MAICAFAGNIWCHMPLTCTGFGKTHVAGRLSLTAWIDKILLLVYHRSITLGYMAP